MLDSLNDLARFMEKTMLGTNVIFKDRNSGQDKWLGKDTPMKGLTYEQSNRHQRNQLQLAVERGDISKVRELARLKHLLNHQDINGDTALTIAVKKQSLFAIRALLAEKADPTIANKQGETALTLAEKNDNQKIKEDVGKYKKPATANLSEKL